MANIGDQLLQPEDGWQRIDIYNTNSNFEFSSNFTFLSGRSDAFGGTFVYLKTGVTDGYIKFNFIGSKLRIIAVCASTRAKNASISIDNLTDEMTGIYNNVEKTYDLVYEKLNLSYKEHSVLIISGTGGSYSNLHLDAIDIDKSGILKSYNPNLNPNKYLIKSSNQYYSIKPEFYDGTNDIYNPQLISELNADNLNTYGIDNLSEIHYYALNKLIINKYHIIMLK